MDLILLSIIGIFLIVMFFFADTGKRKVIGVLASLLLFIMAAWIFTDGVQQYSGNSITSNETIETNSSVENFTVTSSLLNKTEIFVYQDISVPVLTNIGFPFKDLLGLILVGIGLIGLMHYGIDITL